MRTEDGYIIYKCLSGDTEAFGFLVDKYKAGVYASAYARVRDFHHAEDVSQEVFIKAYQKLHTLKRWDSFASWLYRITLNICKDWIRAASRRPEYEALDDQHSVVLDRRAMDSHNDERLFESLHEALNSLPEEHRQVLMLHYLGGMTSYEIARFAGVSSAAIRKRLGNARSKLKVELLADMGPALQQNRLKASFTLRIIETVRRIKIHPMPGTPGLPWGLSIATGIILILLGLRTYTDIPNPLHLLMDSSPLGETTVSKDGEIPVDLWSATLMSAPLREDDRTSDFANNAKQLTFVDSDVLISSSKQAMKGNIFPKYPAMRLGKESLCSIAYSPDGRMLAAGGMDKIWLYDTYSLTEIGLLQGHKTLSGIISIAFSSDGKILASGGINDSVRIWDVRKQKQIGALPKSDKAFTTSPDLVPNPLVFGPDSIILATARTDGAICLWNAQQQEQMGTLHGHTGQVTTIAFSADGKTLVSVGMDSTTRFWSVHEQKQIGVLDENVWFAQAGAISPDRRTLALYDQHSLCFLDVQNKEQLAVIEKCRCIESIAFSPGGEILASGHSDGIIRLWDATKYKQLGIFQPRTVGSVKHVIFNPDGRTLASLTEGDAICFWDVRQKRRTGLLEGYIGIYNEAFTSPIAFSPDSKLLALKGHGAISLLDVENQERVGSLHGYDNYVINVAFSPDGKILVSNHYGGNIYIWDVGKQKQKGLLKAGNSVDAIAFSPDGRTLTSTSNLISPQMNTFILSFWDIQDKKLLFNIEEDGFSYGIAFSPDGQTLASAHYGGIYLWDFEDQKQIGMLETVNRAFAVAFSPDGETLASAHYGGINLWFVDEQEQKILLKSSEPVFAVAFSPGGRLLAAGYNDGAVGLWDIDEQKQVGSLKGHKTEVMYLAFSPDGKWLASESADSVIFLWKVNIQAK